MAFGNRGVLSHSGGVMQVNNALIEEISTSNNTTGYIIISYSAGLWSPEAGSHFSLEEAIERADALLYEEKKKKPPFDAR